MGVQPDLSPSGLELDPLLKSPRCIACDAIERTEDAGGGQQAEAVRFVVELADLSIHTLNSDRKTSHRADQ
jgi:hypothetical protein